MAETTKCPWCDDKKTGVAVYGIRILEDCGMQCGNVTIVGAGSPKNAAHNAGGFERE